MLSYPNVLFIKEIMEKQPKPDLRRAIAEFEPDQSFGSVPPASSHVLWIHRFFLLIFIVGEISWQQGETHGISTSV